MTSADLIAVLGRHRLRVFTTADFLTLTGLSPAAATQALRRLAARSLVAKLRKSVWANRAGIEPHPYEAVPYLRAPWPAYVSLHSALADYGVTEEVPHLVYAVTSALPKRYATPLGDYRFHHLPPSLMWGYEVRRVGAASYPIAGREKAFLDLAYLALIPRSPLQFPPKRGRGWPLDRSILRAHARRFAFLPLQRWLSSEKLI
jgi:predicted transcriptional regulator of viral defense system